jgi:hypothetical protein
MSSRLKNIGVVIFSGSMFAVKAPVLQLVNTPNAFFSQTASGHNSQEFRAMVCSSNKRQPG